jgi:hypothetical protein
VGHCQQRSYQLLMSISASRAFGLILLEYVEHIRNLLLSGAPPCLLHHRFHKLTFQGKRAQGTSRSIPEPLTLGADWILGMLAYHPFYRSVGAQQPQSVEGLL